jgi:hypothetical protein
LFFALGAITLKTMTIFVRRLTSWSARVPLGFRALLIASILLSALSGQPLVLEDFSCYQITNAVSSGPNTNLTCITPHGIPVGTRYHIWVQGGTGEWAAVNTQNEMINNGAFIAPTDSTILVNNTTFVELGLAELYNEKVNIVSKDANHLYLGTRPGCDANGRACDGTVAQAYAPQKAGITVNVVRPIIWDALALDVNTLQIPLNSSSFSTTFTGSGQTVYMRRALYSADPASPNIRVYTGEPWSLFDQAGPNGLTVTIPKCTDKTDAYKCSLGFYTPFNGKGYSLASASISSFVVSANTATIKFATPFVDSGTNATLRSASDSTDGIGALVWINGMDESGTGVGKLNRPYLVSDVIMSGATKIGFHAAITGVPDGAYSGASPSLSLPYLMGSYVDSNWQNGSADSYPASTARSFLKNGAAWDPSYNRFRFWMKYDGVSRSAADSVGISFGTYVFWGTDPADKAHGYHSADFAVNDGRWVKIEMNQRYQGLVGGGSDPDASADPFLNAGSSAPPVAYPAWRGGTRHYLDALERWYVDSTSSGVNTPPLWGATQTFKRFEFDKSLNEPEELIAGRSIQYDGAKYMLGVFGPKQSISCGLCGDVPVTYNFYYSTGGSMKSGGIASGTFAGTASLAGDGRAVFFSSANMSEASNIWWAIRPTAPVYATSGSGASPIWIWSLEDYGMQVGDHVTTANISGNTAANVTNAAIVSVQPKQSFFRFQPNTGAFNTPGQITSVVSDGSTCTVTLTVNHNLIAGWPIFVSDGFPTGGPKAGFYKVSQVPSATIFGFSCPSTSPGTYNTDYNNLYHMAIQTMPGFAVAGTGNGTYSNATLGTMVSTDDKKNFAEISYSEPETVQTVPVAPTCDLNGDGSVTSADVNLSIGMVLGSVPCTARLDGSSTCNVVDVQRVIMASMGGPCKVGQ